jgi:hypothetical protein
MVDVIMEINVRFQACFQVFSTVGKGYGELTLSVIVEAIFNCPCKGCDFCCTNIEFHIINIAPILYRVNVISY